MRTMPAPADCWGAARSHACGESALGAEPLLPLDASARLCLTGAEEHIFDFIVVAIATPSTAQTRGGPSSRCPHGSV